MELSVENKIKGPLGEEEPFADFGDSVPLESC
jgi:hypothetical protein